MTLEPSKPRHRPPRGGAGRKPDWLKILPGRGGREQVGLRRDLREKGLHTVCEEARCPNQGECWGEGTATIMILGGVCTRGCRFCAVTSGNPRGAIDPLEPQSTARAVARMGVRHVVITSVDRDDLPDHGASCFAQTVRACRDLVPDTAVEVLIGDLGGDLEALRTVVAARPDVLAHNLETVRRLTPRVRDPRAGFDPAHHVSHRDLWGPARCPDLTSLLEDDRAGVMRRNAIIALANIGTEEAMAVLQRHKRTDSGGLAEYFAWAIDRVTKKMEQRNQADGGDA